MDVGEAVEKDPVCGMTVKTPRPERAVEHAGRTYYFCSDRCRDRFAADPEAILSRPPPERAAHGHAGPGSGASGAPAAG
ncbi:YHS domain-containing protein, partial [Candidatus Binatia bacterium]|nr:YHS domain-containing protein [Candidatus Binatia bacterium]